jgi:hypothetical protein
MQNGEPDNVLAYATPEPRNRYRLIRIIAIAVILVTLLVMGWKFGPTIRERVRVWQVHRACMSLTQPEDTVAYFDGPSGSQDFLAKGGYERHSDVKVARTPEPWASFAFNVVHALRTAIFCHERRSSGGNLRLVVIHDDFCYSILKPPSLWHRPERVWPAGSRRYFSGLPLELSYWDQPIKVYAGQPDLNDESHFTVRFESAGRPGIIDGWLQDDDSVKLEVREGPGKLNEAQQQHKDRILERWRADDQRPWHPG